MRAFLAWSSICLALVGCKQQAAGGPAATAAAAPGAPTGPLWSEAKVKAYLKLQAELIGVLRGPAGADGGRARAATLSEQEVAAAEERARQASGLTDEEVATLHSLSTALITREVLRRLAETGSMQRQLAEARAALPAGSAPEVDEALAAIAERRKREDALAEERARFGDALIDAALPHRAALMENWSKLMDAAGEVGEAR